jgi:GDPmannose 4,6-dehydratase
MGSKKCLELGNLYAKRDWGYAKDYVEAMWLMLQQKKPDDYVIGTGKSHSIKQFINQVCKNLDLKIKWVGKKKNERAINILNSKTIIRINKKYYRPSEVNFLKADFNKAKKKLKWSSKTSFKKLVEIMVESEIKILILKNR